MFSYLKGQRTKAINNFLRKIYSLEMSTLSVQTQLVNDFFMNFRASRYLETLKLKKIIPRVNRVF